MNEFDIFQIPPDVFANRPRVYKSRIIERTEATKQGFKTYYENEPLPQKIIHNPGAEIGVQIIKKTLNILLRILSKPYFGLPAIIFFNIKKMFQILEDSGFRDDINPHVLKREFYCPAVGELYDAIKNKMIRNIICHLFQYDNSYRYRMQDILGNLDKSKPLKREIIRLFDLWLTREKAEKMIRKRWLLKKALWIFLLIFWFKYGRIAKEFVQKIDIEKIKMDEADIYYCLNRPDYDFQGKSYEKRIMIYFNKYGKAI